MKRSLSRFDFDALVRLCTMATALAVMGLCAESHAGIDYQGIDYQGIDYQGETLEGAAARQGWLQGDRLQGIRIDAQTAEASMVDVRGFYGNTVDARVWRPETGYAATVLQPKDLLGMEWTERRCQTDRQCAQVSYRIANVTGDPSQNTMPAHGDNDDLWLYEVQQTTAATPGAGDWRNVCRPDRHGMARGLFVNGRWDRSGAWHARGYTFGCTSGVIAKCARNWGYKPWKRLKTAGGQPIGLRPLHQACTRAARADYCGDGASWTREGTLVDLFDRYGLNTATADPALHQEAGFTQDGAAWVARTRWPMGAEQRGAALDLGACRRPRQPLSDAGERALVYIRSQPRHAR